MSRPNPHPPRRLSLQNSALRVPLLISLGAIAGALSRYYFTLLCTQWFGLAFPYGTFFINLSGAFGMGYFTTIALERIALPADLRFLIAVGFLGSYTTFSTYELDTARLITTHSEAIAIFYWLGTATLGILCAELGCLLARRLP